MLDKVRNEVRLRLYRTGGSSIHNEADTVNKNNMRDNRMCQESRPGEY